MTINNYQEAVRLAKARQFQAAETLCNQLLEKSPDDYQLLYLLCSINLLLSRYEECRKLCHRLLQMNDKNADVYSLLAAISADFDKNDAETEKWLKLALTCDPSNPKVLVSLGNLKFFSGFLEEAQSLFEQATSPESPNADAISGLAMVAGKAGNLDDAILGYKQALELDPAGAEILSNLILALYKADRKEDAIHYAMLAASMGSPGVASVPAMAVAKMNALFDVAEKLLPLALDQLQMLPNDPALYSFSSLSFLSASSLGNEQMLAVHRQAGTVIRRALKHASYCDYPEAFSKTSPIRIGYLSSDFNAHVLGHFFRGLINFRDRKKFEIVMYSNLAQSKEDATTQQYRAAVDHFVNVYEMDDSELAKRIHDDGIHILVEMNGHVGTLRLPVLAYKPAPVQIAYLNYPYTYGMEEVDYVISDPWLNGKDNANYFDETPLEMSQSFITIGDYDEKEISAEPARKRKGYLTFGSLSNIYKLNKKTIALWSSVLKRVPNSRMHLNHPGYSLQVSREAVLTEFSRYGIPSDRIDIVWERHPSGSHLRYYNEMDISLDTLPLTGGTTTLDSLWMAVPVITLAGEAHAQRLSYSIINNVGIDMDDCIAFSEAEYLDRAVKLASNSVRLDELRTLIPGAMLSSILCDPVSFTRQMETLYIRAWNNKFPSKKIGGPMKTSLTVALPVSEVNCKVVVEDDPDDIYCYILREQQGWFETESSFLTEVASHFNHFWDFSNDPGVFALPIACSQSASGGETLAIRSSLVMADLIQQSIQKNKLHNLKVVEDPHVKETLPDLIRFSLDMNDGEGSLLSPWLDRVDSSSPLIMASLRNPQGSDLSAMPTLAERGYQSYRLLPGYGLLVPHRFGDRMYANDINLFFCKPDRAQKLSDSGLLCLAIADIDNMPAVDATLWAELLKDYGYADTYLKSWIEHPIAGKSSEMYLTALNLYTEARNTTLSPPQRYARIQLVQSIMTLLIQSEATAPRLLSGIRIMVDSGNREMAIQWARILHGGVQGMSGILFDEPFLAPEKLWESLPIPANEVDWASSMALISQERLSRFSSWFTGDQSLLFWQSCTSYPWLEGLALHMTELIQNRYHDNDSTELVGHITGKIVN